MARKANKGSFQKGQVNNPRGKPKLPDDLKHLMHATGEQVKRDLCEVYNTHLETIRSLQHRQDLPAGLAMIAACMVNAIETGDNRIMASFLDRLIGKPIDTLDLKSGEDSGITVIVKDYIRKKDEA